MTTTSSSIRDVVHLQGIPEALQGFRYGVDLSGSGVAWVEQVPDGAGTDFRFPRSEELVTPATPKVEGTGAFSVLEFTTDTEVATSGTYGFTLRISREGQKDAVPAIPRLALEEGVRSLRRQLNVAMLAPATGAASAVGSDTADCTVAHLAAALAEFETLNPEATEVAIVLHSGRQWEQLLDDLATTSATLLAPAGAAGVMRATPGFKGVIFGNVALYTSPHVAVSGDAQHGLVTQMGRYRSGLGLAIWQGIQVEHEPEGSNYNDLFHFSARWGAVLSGQPITAIRSTT
jgi:hypothetical protein